MRDIDRRTLLGGLGGAAATVTGCVDLSGEVDRSTGDVDEDTARELAERFAPTLYFDRDERWYPTDPREYETREDGVAVVDGFDAFDSYVEDGGAEDPPHPTVFYHVVEYEGSSLAVVQYWFYSVFDQFTTNFHWHDWEVLQVFVDVDSEEPQLYVASSHSRGTPNNEHLDPVEGRRPRVLSELGSHSSGLSVNDDADGFQRFALDFDFADVTNRLLEGVDLVSDLPLAYGLPRDEGFGLPFAVPTLEGRPIHENERFDHVSRSDLLPDSVTFGSLEELLKPPNDLPRRETGQRWEYEGRAEDADVAYDLVSTQEVEDIAGFEGPRLSFEFTVPDFAEDLLASHLSAADVPWTQPRYEDPIEDVTEPAHRRALAERYPSVEEPSAVDQIVAYVSDVASADDAPEGQGLTTEAVDVEVFALLESEPEAVPTFNGVAVVQDVDEGSHRFTVNGAGVAPHSEEVEVAGGEGTTAAGVEGEVPLVAREDAVKLAVEPGEGQENLTDLAVEDDFAGRLYDAPLSERDAVYVHRGGAYTTEVRDESDELGAFRVDPGDQDRVEVADARTGKAVLADYVADVANETRRQVEDVAGEAAAQGGADGGDGSAVQGLSQALEAVAEAARRAAERADAGDRGGADRQLDAVQTRLQRVATRLGEARDGLPDEVANAVENRLEQSNRRSRQARNAEKLGRRSTSSGT